MRYPTRSRRLASWLVCPLLISALLVLPAVPAEAVSFSPAPMGIVGFGGIAVSTTYVFVAGSSQLAVADHDLNVVATVPLADQAGDVLAVGSSLYVSFPDLNRIDRFSIASMPPTFDTSFPTGQYDYPGPMTSLGGLVWFGYGTGFASLDPVDGTIKATSSLACLCQQLVSSPGDPNHIVVLPKYGDDITSYDVSSGYGVQTGIDTHRDTFWGALPDDGSTLYLPGGNSTTNGAWAHDPITLTAQHAHYQTEMPAWAGAVSPDGETVVMLSDRDDHLAGLQITTYATSDHSQLASTNITGDGTIDLVQGSMRYSPDGSAIFVAILQHKGALTVQRFPGVPQDGDVRLSGPRRGSAADTVRYTVTLGVASSTSNHKVFLYRTSDSGRSLLGSGDVNADGKRTFSIKLTTNMQLEAVWKGDDNYLKTFVHKYVHVAADVKGVLRGWYQESDGVHLYHSTNDVLYVVKVFPNHAGESVNIGLERHTSSGWTVVDSEPVKLNADSVAAIGATLQRQVTYRLRAYYSGDRTNGAGSSSYAYLRVTG